MPYALIAPITSVPSRPRLIRPLRSVMHSPRLTNRNGVETRIAPPSTASGTVQYPIDPGSVTSGRLSLQEAHAAIERVARKHDDEDGALQHEHRGIRQAETPLQQPAARADAAEEDRDRDDRQRILPRQERHQDAAEAVARRQIGVGAAL